MVELVVGEAFAEALVEGEHGGEHSREERFAGVGERDELGAAVLGGRCLVMYPAFSIRLRWWVSVASSIPIAAAMSRCMVWSPRLSAVTMSQAGSEPPAATSSSSNARLSSRPVRVTSRPIGSVAGRTAAA